SSNTQGTYLNQVFIGMFRPEGNAYPRWVGNLKQYQFGVGGTVASPTLFLADATLQPALTSAGTGFFSPNAQSFWTSKDVSKLPDSIGGMFVNNPQGVSDGFDLVDGELVEKGGVAQRLRMANLQDNYTANPRTPRNLYTCNGACADGSSLSGYHFATDNANITAAQLATNGPPLGITSITRSGTTATVTLSSAPTPPLTSGQSVTIAGSQYTEYNGTFNITPTSTTTFTYTVTLSPPTPATGAYTATVPSVQKPVAPLTRLQTVVTASSAAHGFITGQSVTITGATNAGYNGTFAVTGTTANTFTYSIVEGPPTPDGGGTAKVGATSLAIAAGGIVRNPSAGATNVSEVTVTFSVNVTFAVGNTVVIAAAGPGGVSPYNGSWTITKLGTSCQGGSKSGSNPRSFCFNFNSTPASPDGGGAIKADGATTPLAITGLTYAGTGCTATATAVTGSAPTFVAGQTANIGGTPGANEAAYVGSFTIASVKLTSPYNFTFTLPISPGCSDTTGGMTATIAGVARDTLINWVRGKDNAGDEASPGNGITIRPSVHGDVVHSRPAVVNYGGSVGVVVFYGANDGVFRAINGNQPLNGSPTIGTAPPGGEIFGFIPTEFYGKLSRLYFNSPIVKLATTPAGITPTPTPKDYFFDGATSVYQNGSTVSVFLSARRGGRFIYAFNVNDPTDPKLLWKKSNSDFPELGYTWSAPKAARVRGYPNPVVIFGGGYDSGNNGGSNNNLGEDAEPPSANTMGRAIYILDATDGSLVWKAVYSASGGASCNTNPCLLSGMAYGIPADVTLVNRDFDTSGYIDRLYAADVGGNIWRVDLEPAGYSALASAVGPSTWQVTQFASLGGTGTTKRKFFYSPDVVATKNFDMVLAATGDREHPMYSASGTSSYAIKNRFYAMKDTKIGPDATGFTTIADNTTTTAYVAVTGMTDATSTTYSIATNNSGFYRNFAN
ncbi:MAG: hypothetical protein ABIP55_16155, partial [Tepidisphaeraceae bacterium]